MIPCVDPKAGYLAHKREIDAAVRDVMDSGLYLHGPKLSELERSFANYIGSKFAIGVGSGTEALRLALAASGVGSGDEVITVSFTCSATIAAIELTGATPVVVDIEPDFFTLDPERIEAVLTPRTKALVPVHLFGQPANAGVLQDIAERHGLLLIEDASQSHGASYMGRKVGSWGHAGCFSFYPTKNLGAFGDAGMIVTSDAKIADNVRLLREYGWKQQHKSMVKGWNSRLDEIQAAVLLIKLPHLDKDNEARARAAERYTRLLSKSGIVLPSVRPHATSAWHQFVVRTPNRQGVREQLLSRGITALVHYPTPVHLQPAYRNQFAASRAELQETERAAQEVLSLPLYAQIPDEHIEDVAAALLSIRVAVEQQTA